MATSTGGKTVSAEDQTPRELAEDALHHFLRACVVLDVPDDLLRTQTRRASAAMERQRAPSLPAISDVMEIDLTPFFQAAYSDEEPNSASG